MGLLDLNDDVLALILSEIPSLDALHLATTCRLAYRLALPHALSDVYIPRYSARYGGSDKYDCLCLRDFCALMLGTPNRLVHLRKLLVDCAHISRKSSCASLFSDVLIAASQLKSLVVYGVDHMMAAHPGLGDAISRLSNMDHLEICGVCASSFSSEKIFSQSIDTPEYIPCNLHTQYKYTLPVLLQNVF